jgi:hypothetical protein
MIAKCHVTVSLAIALVVAFPTLAPAQASLPTGEVSGRVSDADGGRPPAVRVEALRMAADASGRLEPAGSARAADDGSYRIERLPAGEYYIAAVAIVDASTPGQPEAPPATYYPGVFDELEAQPVSLEGDGGVENIDFRLRTDPGVRVTGVMVSHDNKPLRTGQVTMSLVNQTGAVVGPTARARIYPDGSFFFLNILPGRYLLRASGQTFGDQRSLVASQPVDVSSASVTGLRLVLQPGALAPVAPVTAEPATTEPASPDEPTPPTEPTEPLAPIPPPVAPPA